MGAEKQNFANRIPADVALIVFGRDRSRKPHASRFGAAAVIPAQASTVNTGSSEFGAAIAELERLGQLHTDRHLNDDEYGRLKAAVLRRI